MSGGRRYRCQGRTIGPKARPGGDVTLESWHGSVDTRPSIGKIARQGAPIRWPYDGAQDAEVLLLYWIFKWTLFGWAVRLLFKPWIEGRENLPERGPAILVSNHISAGDTFLLPAMIRRRLTFPAKAELFHGKGLKAHLLSLFLKGVGQVPLDRSGGRASAGSMDSVLGVLESGKLLGIYPEGTRSPDGRLYKGKTGVARLVLQSGVPVIPVAMINTQLVP